MLVNKVEGFHTADRGTELKILFPHPQTCLKNSSFCFFFFLLRFHHAAIAFPSLEESLRFYVHIHCRLISHNKRRHVRRM